MTTGTSYTFTRQELLTEVQNMFKEMLPDFIDEIVTSRDERIHWMSLLTKIETDDNELIRYWSDAMSESWFENNPGITDVLLQGGSFKNEPVYVLTKRWIASAPQKSEATSENKIAS